MLPLPLLGLLIFICLVYSVLDIYNKKNIPLAFIIAFLLVALFTATVYNYGYIIFGLEQAGIIFLAGCLIGLLKKPPIGPADFILLITIAILVPFQPQALLLPSLSQAGLPFVISVVLASIYAIILYIIILKSIKRKIPQHLPLTPFIFIGVIVSLLLGNLLLFIFV